MNYRNPPKHSRFKKGQSGNPKGRPKNLDKELILIVNKLFNIVKLAKEGDELEKLKIKQIKEILK